MIWEPNRMRGSEPNNVVFPQYGLAFLVIPKCCNTSIKDALSSRFRDDSIPTLKGLRHAYLQNIPEGYLKMAVVRNPYARAVSIYNNKVADPGPAQIKRLGFNKKMSFAEFCAHMNEIPDDYDGQVDMHLKSQTYFLTLNGELKADYIAKQEEFLDSWKRLSEIAFDRCGVRVPNLPHKNRSGKYNLRDYYNERSAAHIYHRFKQDFKVLGYAVDQPGV